MVVAAWRRRGGIANRALIARCSSGVLGMSPLPNNSSATCAWCVERARGAPGRILTPICTCWGPPSAPGPSDRHGRPNLLVPKGESPSWADGPSLTRLLLPLRRWLVPGYSAGMTRRWEALCAGESTCQRCFPQAERPVALSAERVPLQVTCRECDMRVHSSGEAASHDRYVLHGCAVMKSTAADQAASPTTGASLNDSMVRHSPSPVLRKRPSPCRSGEPFTIVSASMHTAATARAPHALPVAA